LAAQAAQRGEVRDLRRYAEELLARQAKEADSSGAKADRPSTLVAGYHCPVDLAAPFPGQTAASARALGLAVAQTEPLPQAGPLFEYVAARADQADFSDIGTEREGALRAEALVDEVGFPSDLAAPIKVLVGQFVRNPFVNSGGARYLPRFVRETVLIEDFPEG